MDLTAAGKTFPPFEFRVERGKIKEFADAIGDPNPIYRDPAHAGAILAPPTLLRTFLYEPRTSAEALKVKDWSYIVHGEQEFEYLAPICAGDVLDRNEAHRQHHREGKPPRRQAAHRGDRDRVHQPARREGADRAPHAGRNQPAHQRLSRERNMPTPSFDSIKIGDAPKPLVCGPLTRTDFVRYAGASLDLNPNHHDEVYAQRNGNKTVFGMGMLAGGYCGRLMTDWFGDGDACAGCASASPRASGRTTCSPSRRALLPRTMPTGWSTASSPASTRPAR